jgi:hypothetical protein
VLAVGVGEGSGVLPGVDGVGVDTGLDRRGLGLGLGEDGVAVGDGEVVDGDGDGDGEWLGESGGFVACCPVCVPSWPVLLVAVLLAGRTQK